MKKIAISLIALAAVSTAAFATQRTYDLRESPTYVGQYSELVNGKASAAFAVAKPGSSEAPTNAELLKRNQLKNESSSN